MHQKLDTEESRSQGRERRLDLSVPQVAGSALAAVTAAVLASRLGVYGTIIGAGVVSVVATCGGSVLQHLFSRTGEQLREVTVQARPTGRRSAGRTPSGVTEPERAGRAASRPGEFTSATTHGTRVRGWKRPLIAAAVVFGVAMGGVTAYEVASGSELSGGTGTTVGSVVGGGGSGGRQGPADEPAPAPDGSHDDRSRETERQSPDPAPGDGGEGTSPGPDGGAVPPERGEGNAEEGSPDGTPGGTDAPDESSPPTPPAPRPSAEEGAPAPAPSAPAAGGATDR